MMMKIMIMMMRRRRIMVAWQAWQWRPTSKIGAKWAGISYLLANWELEKKQRRLEMQ